MATAPQMHANPRKTKNVRYLGKVDVAALREKVLAIPEEQWAAEDATKPNRFDVLGGTQHIVFRFVSNVVDWRDSYARPIWDEWKPLLEPVLAQATADYGYARGAFPRVMLARLPAGGVIQPHSDSQPVAKWPHKIHVPLKTNHDVSFFVGETAHRFEVGEAVEVNNMGSHAVANRGSEDRIHLIFEYFDLDQPEPEWLRQVTASYAQQQSAM